MRPRRSGKQLAALKRQVAGMCSKELIQSIQWEEMKHPFFLETIVKPLRRGVEVVEIPTAWRARSEGESKNTFLRNFVCFRIGLKTRFASCHSILKGIN